ncbi:CHAT domain-containing protein [Planosporangium sp. 12N6]|uniref:CHAT domain-containing protein n=1 Tax=Planosporangium spinosum TaxID=3402278 RepID=UPI003CF588B4
MTEGGAAAMAQRSLDAVQRSPRESISLARRALAAARTTGDTEARSTAYRAIGLALRELNDYPAALRHLRRAVATAEAAGSARLAALARMSLGYVLAGAGRNTAALRAVTAALAELTGADAGRARMQRGVVHHYRGHYVEAARDYGMAVEIARSEGDAVLEARARNNRGLLRAHLGALSTVDDDLDRAAEIFSRLGLDLAAADVRWNSGIAAAQRGHVPRALRVFAEVEQEYRRLDVPRPALALDRLELLLSIPLVDDAGAVAAAAVRELRRRRMASDLAEAMLAQARVALLAGDPQAAMVTATRARDRLRRQGRRTWAVFAQHVALRAAYRDGVRTAPLLSSMVRTAGQLDEVGWQAPALATRIDAARVARDLHRPRQARELLEVAARARRGGTASRRVQGWYALALARRLDGDDARAAAALRRGLAVLDEYRASLGATELRASSGTHGQELASEGLDIALAGGRPGQVLAWAEYGRAGALRMTPALPPGDPRLAAALAELRAVSTELEEALLAGRPAEPLRGRQTRLEQQIRELSRRAGGGRRGQPPPGVRRLADRLGPAVLVELVAHGGRLRAVVVADGRATLHDLGGVEAAREQLRLLRFGLRRLVTMAGSAAARAASEHAARRLDAQLFGPLRRRTGERPLVIVATGELNALPWSALPTAAGDRPVAVVPSAAAWLRAAGRPAPDGDAVLVAGPRLPAAVAEVTALAAIHPTARVLCDERAAADAVAGALSGAGLAHVAAHGTFRADNPLFSTIELADGPLTAYELEGLRRPPGCLVLSTCDSGRSAVVPGDELIGFTAVLLGLGTRTLIASVLPVPADATTALMTDLHRRMRAGAGPAAALAAARRASVADGGDLGYAAAAAFVCFGAG